VHALHVEQAQRHWKAAAPGARNLDSICVEVDAVLSESIGPADPQREAWQQRDERDQATGDERGAEPEDGSPMTHAEIHAAAAAVRASTSQTHPGVLTGYRASGRVSSISTAEYARSASA
jgi:hypothetical protein